MILEEELKKHNLQKLLKQFMLIKEPELENIM